MNPHIPDEIANDEDVHVRSRRRKLGVADDAPALGLALSGGGIRSATVCLGVFQYLAHEERRARDQAATPPSSRLLSRIDYCSSVSGGGYFATFFGSLFLPSDERAKGAQLTPDAMVATDRGVAAGPPTMTKWERAANRAADVLCDSNFDGSRMTPLRWLRENGRYLAPTASSDYLYAAAVGIRNFAALHYVIAVTLLTMLLLAAAPRVFGFGYAIDTWFPNVEDAFMPSAGAHLWLSAWWSLPVATFVLLVVPISAAFFLAQTERWGKRLRLNLPLITAFALAALCLIVATTGETPPLAWPGQWLSAVAAVDLRLHAIARWNAARLITAYIGITAILAALFYIAARIVARWPSRSGGPRSAPTRAGEPAATTIARTTLSHWVMKPLIATLVLAAFALVDTIGQSVYALWTVHQGRNWLIGSGTLALLIPLLQKALPLLTNSGDPTTKAWIRIPLSALALVAGVALFVAVASLWSILAHATVYAGERPFGDPGCVMAADAMQGHDVALDASKRIVVDTPPAAVACESGATPIAPMTWAWLFVPLLVIAVFTGHSVGFINLSSLQRFYAGHLMRSYLRASLFAENPDAERDVRSAARADDITVDTYYHPSSLAPLHLINVTMNQTMASGSQLVQRDRKGMNLAIGPCGFSIGNRSFVRWDLSKINYTLQRSPATVIGVPDDSALPRYRTGTRLVLEPLSIGNWCAISGAAFTTGHGKGTTLGLSLLLALTNVRLGYWWNAEVARPAPLRKGANDSPAMRGLSAVFGTQSYLLNEMFARYAGSRRSHWYLSDGGHFENTAAYELIRRRVPRIIVLDNGRDLDYAFDDMANLARKARIDFAAEIEFLTAREMHDLVDPSARPYLGTPDEFKPGASTRAYATLARIRYKDAPEGLMLILKPRIAGVEPLDILNYRQASNDFPQQSTTDQFYDEAQWESYRKLGYWMAEHVFGARPNVTPGKWTPRAMFA